ncbi:hypothetical protein TGAM01_v210875 [Trichoderma gamsii]|uniref:Uncharacterized protein n=1 Tax=Trichoderma gamsii TaxID=398673 RepID=A0A2P4Z7L1_9HYPO|nr:hypothetical protein TGAM01_v210875 [Trichoderma gamsii]PON20279.1 hypothetical protein TGAM01_v210875 [Trichoderma gamsii]
MCVLVPLKGPSSYNVRIWGVRIAPRARILSLPWILCRLRAEHRWLAAVDNSGREEIISNLTANLASVFKEVTNTTGLLVLLPLLGISLTLLPATMQKSCCAEGILGGSNNALDMHKTV